MDKRKPSEQPESSPKSLKQALSMEVCTWNVLSFHHTHHFTKLGGVIAKGGETIEQRNTRYEILISLLTKTNPDVWLLQEVDRELIDVFLKESEGKQVSDVYHVFTSGMREEEQEKVKEGCAILLRKSRFQEPFATHRIAPSKLSGGKSGVVVTATDTTTNSLLAFGSIHLRWGDRNLDRQIHHLSQMRDMVARAKPEGAILGGDFNRDVESGDNLMSKVPELEICLPQDDSITTALGGDLKSVPNRRIDHVLVWKESKVVSSGKVVAAGPLLAGVDGLYDGENGCGSDHTWVKAEIVMSAL